MRVVIDLSPLKSGHQYRGIGVYTKLLYKALQQLDDGNEYVLTTKVSQTKADVIHYPFFDLFFLTLPIRKTTPTVITIHDTIPLIFPEQYKPGKRGKIKFWQQKKRLKGVKEIITVSETSKSDIEKYLDQPEDKIQAVYSAANSSFKPATKKQIKDSRSRYLLEGDYILYVGDINYNKNLPGLIKAYADSKSNLDLVLVSRALGKMIPESEEVFGLIDKYKLKEKIKILTNVPSDPHTDVIGLYSGARWYIQPSFYEGFGLPVLEAWACETPVLSSTGGSLDEITQDAAITFDPYKNDEMKKVIETASKMKSDERRKWITKGKKRNGDFSWEKTANETVEVYKLATSKKKRE